MTARTGRLVSRETSPAFCLRLAVWTSTHGSNVDCPLVRGACRERAAALAEGTPGNNVTRGAARNVRRFTRRVYSRDASASADRGLDSGSSDSARSNSYATAEY